jgi:hypothetical protein
MERSKKNYIQKFSFALIIILAVNLWGSAQNISEQLDAISTDFEFTSNGKSLNVVHQQIIKRPGHRSSGDSGFGFETHRLEFETNTSLVKLEGRIRDRYNPYHFYFLNEQNDTLAFIKLDRQNVLTVFTSDREDNEIRFYSVDLRTIPILVLDQTRRIDVIHYTK